MPVLGGDGLEGIQDAGALAEGVYLSSPYFPSIPSDANPVRRGVPPQIQRGAQPARGRHVRRDLLAARRNRSGGLGPRADSPGPRRRRLRHAAIRGVTGTVAFDANGDVPNQNVYIGLVQHGAVTVVNGVEETVVGAR